MAQFLAFLQKNPYHLLLFVAAVVSGGMLLWPLVSRTFRPGNEVGVLEAVQLINRRDALVLDVREPGEYAAGHVPNARHIPERELAGRIKEIEKFKSRPVVVTCRTGARSGAACTILRKHGFNEVFSLRGGIVSWQQAAMPVEKHK